MWSIACCLPVLHRGKKIALDVARGLYFMHERKLIHFDIKSLNVLLAADGTAKIADVGLAKVRPVDAMSLKEF
jgi:serine/threonine protein kinase